MTNDERWRVGWRVGRKEPLMNTKKDSLRRKEWAGDGGEPTLFVCQNFGDGCGDGFGRELGEIAAAGGWAGGRLEEAGGRREDRAGAHGVGRTEEGEEGDAEGVGEVHAAGVVGDEEAAGTEARGVVGEGGAAREVFDAGGGKTGGDGAGERSVVGRAEEDEVRGWKRFDEGAPVGDGPAFGGCVFRARDEADGCGRSGERRVGNGSGQRGAVERSEQAEVAKKIFPELELVMRAFVEIGRDTVGVGQKRARFAGADEAEALTAAAEPSLEVAAEGIGEEQPHVEMFAAKAQPSRSGRNVFFATRVISASGRAARRARSRGSTMTTSPSQLGRRT